MSIERDISDEELRSAVIKFGYRVMEISELNFAVGNAQKCQDLNYLEGIDLLCENV